MSATHRWTSSVQAYIADGTPSKVAERDQRRREPQQTGARVMPAAAGAVAGSLLMQYPDYLIGLFPYGNDKHA